MKRWLKVLVGLLVLVVLAYWLLVDRAIQWVIEREATREVKARVELERVRFHLYPTSLTLHGLQVTNPSSPMHNLVEAGRKIGSASWRERADSRVGGGRCCRRSNAALRWH